MGDVGGKWPPATYWPLTLLVLFPPTLLTYRNNRSPWMLMNHLTWLRHFKPHSSIFETSTRPTLISNNLDWLWYLHLYLSFYASEQKQLLVLDYLDVLLGLVCHWKPWIIYQNLERRALATTIGVMKPHMSIFYTHFHPNVYTFIQKWEISSNLNEYGYNHKEL